MKLEATEVKNKRIGITVSVLFHLLMLILFAFYGLHYMEPPPEEEGITINFGTSDVGMNNTQNNAPTERPTENQPSEVSPDNPTPQEAVEEEVVTQELEEAPSIDKKKEEVEQKIEKKEEKPKPNKKAAEALEKWKNKKTESGGGDGNTNQAGNQGDLDGDPNSNNYEGGGNGNGTTFNLSGRSMVSSPTIQDNSQEEGKVVVDIIVDQYGKVIRATPGARGSNTTNQMLYKKAKQAALQTKFNANPDAAEEQKGQMTFIFILN